MTRTTATRLGVVLPGVNTVIEPWFAAAAPPGVGVHATRMLLREPLTPANIATMDHEEGLRAVLTLSTCRPHAIAYCCTASSIVGGLDYDRELSRSLSRAAGVPVITAAQAICHALHVLAVRRLCFVSPYPAELGAQECAYFVQAGFEVVATDHLGIAESFRLAEPSGDDYARRVHAAFGADADAVVIPCLNARAHDAIAALERALDVPVVTATQATLWHLLRTAGRSDPIPDYGRLLTVH